MNLEISDLKKNPYARRWFRLKETQHIGIIFCFLSLFGLIKQRMYLSNHREYILVVLL